jgi:hypothetical protein
LNDNWYELGSQAYQIRKARLKYQKESLMVLSTMRIDYHWQISGYNSSPILLSDQLTNAKNGSKKSSVPTLGIKRRVSFSSLYHSPISIQLPAPPISLQCSALKIRITPLDRIKSIMGFNRVV